MRSLGLQQAYDFRNANHNLALELVAHPDHIPDAGQRAKALAALTRAWSEADDRVRIHRGKPLPGMLRPSGKAPARRSSGKRRVASVESPIAASGAMQDEPASAASVDTAGSSTDAPTVTPSNAPACLVSRPEAGIAIDPLIASHSVDSPS